MPYNVAIEGSRVLEPRPFLTGELDLPNSYVDPVQEYLELTDKLVVINTGCVARQEVGRHIFGDRLVDFSNGESKELNIDDYRSWCDRNGRGFSVFDYIVFTGVSKLIGRNFGPSARNGNLVALQDTVNVYHNGDTLMPMEKPSGLEDAHTQAKWLVSGRAFLLTTAAIVAEVLDQDDNGRVDQFSRIGVDVTVLPLRFNISPDLRERKIHNMVMSMHQGFARKTPGVVSSASSSLIDHLEVGLWESVRAHRVTPRQVGGYYGYNGLGGKSEPDEWRSLSDMNMSDDPGDRMLAKMLEATITGGDPMSLFWATMRVRDWGEQDPEYIEMQRQLFYDAREMMGMGDGYSMNGRVDHYKKDLTLELSDL